MFSKMAFKINHYSFLFFVFYSTKGSCRWLGKKKEVKKPAFLPHSSMSPHTLGAFHSGLWWEVVPSPFPEHNLILLPKLHIVLTSEWRWRSWTRLSLWSMVVKPDWGPPAAQVVIWTMHSTCVFFWNYSAFEKWLGRPSLSLTER